MMEEAEWSLCLHLHSRLPWQSGTSVKIQAQEIMQHPFYRFTPRHWAEKLSTEHSLDPSFLNWDHHINWVELVGSELKRTNGSSALGNGYEEINCEWELGTGHHPTEQNQKQWVTENIRCMSSNFAWSWTIADKKMAGTCQGHVCVLWKALGQIVSS